MLIPFLAAGLLILGFFSVFGVLVNLVFWLRKRMFPRPEDKISAMHAKIRAIENQRSGAHGGHKFD